MKTKKSQQSKRFINGIKMWELVYEQFLNANDFQQNFLIFNVIDFQESYINTIGVFLN